MNEGESPPGKSGDGGFSMARLAPLAVLGLGLVVFFALDLDRFVSCTALSEHREDLLDFVSRHGLLAPLIFMAVYTMATAFSVPGATLLSVTGGFLFGILLGTTMVVIAATLGACILFLIANTALGEPLRARAGPWMAKMAEGFRENALSYLLVLRLVPLFPFWLVNLVPALLGVPLHTFALGTFVGIIPGAVVYVSVGAGLGSLFDAGGECSLSGVLKPEIIMALVGLAVLALIPVAYKKIKARNA